MYVFETTVIKVAHVTLFIHKMSFYLVQEITRDCL
jgi:hypothetical protein